ncbi:hypothetical protein [Cellulomonas sp. Leaf334]|uniref:hypothetical protein n=1 Tax=Cellulomonas sp. Leaf334 TaxID=1736339 RepID=UPI0006FC5959|nr:hypothetical protein [Cellulomonas sp. Leaf334]KQR17144.1 hypothetical protein ASF78_07500 [Cellulomonas sp. Leaf334]
MTTEPLAPRTRRTRARAAFAGLAAAAVAVTSLVLAPPSHAAPGTSCTGSTVHGSAVQDGSTWRAYRGSTQVWSGSDMLTAINTAIGALDAGRTSKQRVVVNGSGTMSANARITLPSYTTLESCGTIHVSGSGSGNVAGVYARGATDVEVARLALTGTPVYGIFLRNVDNVRLRDIDMRLSGGGIGIRVDNHGDTSRYVRNITINNAYVSGAGSHAVETYGVDGLTVGTITARNVGESGLLLNATINATISLVDAQNAGSGTGYAAFRIANRAGRIGSSYPTNIEVGTVKASGGGRGVFCVSESGGLRINKVELYRTGNNPVLIENCTNVSLATSGGTIQGGDVRLAARSDMSATRDITLRNLKLTDGARIVEKPCVSNLVISNVSGTVVRC